jgi:hypothetical protein
VISIDPEVQGGTPCFRGTRVPVRTLFDHLVVAPMMALMFSAFWPNKSYDWLLRHDLLAAVIAGTVGFGNLPAELFQGCYF